MLWPRIPELLILTGVGSLHLFHMVQDTNAFSVYFSLLRWLKNYLTGLDGWNHVSATLFSSSRVLVFTVTQIHRSKLIIPVMSRMLYSSGVSCTEGIFKYVQVLSKKTSWEVSWITSMGRKNVPIRISQCPLLGLPSCLKVFLITQFTQRSCHHI